MITSYPKCQLFLGLDTQIFEFLGQFYAKKGPSVIPWVAVLAQISLVWYVIFFYRNTPILQVYSPISSFSPPLPLQQQFLESFTPKLAYFEHESSYKAKIKRIGVQ